MNLLFVKEYFKDFRSIGSIVPSSRFLARAMVRPIDFKTASLIVQFGPGTGVFTEEILRKLKPDATLILIEQNPKFAALLTDKFNHDGRVIVEHKSAEHLTKILKKHNKDPAVDYIVSGLPFASLPSPVSSRILKAASKHSKSGVFITFQYTLLKQELFRRYFPHLVISYEFRNVPPAFVVAGTSK